MLMHTAPQPARTTLKKKPSAAPSVHTSPDAHMPAPGLSAFHHDRAVGSFGIFGLAGTPRLNSGSHAAEPPCLKSAGSLNASLASSDKLHLPNLCHSVPDPSPHLHTSLRANPHAYKRLCTHHPPSTSARTDAAAALCPFLRAACTTRVTGQNHGTSTSPSVSYLALLHSLPNRASNSLVPNALRAPSSILGPSSFALAYPLTPPMSEMSLATWEFSPVTIS